MSQDISPLGELCTKLFGEASKPSLSLSISSVDRIEVLQNDSAFVRRSFYRDSRRAYLVVYINSIQIELLDPSRHGVGRAYGIGPSRGRCIRGTKHGNNDFDTGGSILSLDGSTLVSCQPSPLFSFIESSLSQEERESAGEPFRSDRYCIRTR